jgi:hypothetical protein
MILIPKNVEKKRGNSKKTVMHLHPLKTLRDRSFMELGPVYSINQN